MPGHKKKTKKTSMKVGGARGATSGGNAAERGTRRRNGTRGATSGGNAAERGGMKKKYGTRRR